MEKSFYEFFMQTGDPTFYLLAEAERRLSSPPSDHPQPEG